MKIKLNWNRNLFWLFNQLTDLLLIVKYPINKKKSLNLVEIFSVKTHKKISELKRLVKFSWIWTWEISKLLQKLINYREIDSFDVYEFLLFLIKLFSIKNVSEVLYWASYWYWMFLTVKFIYFLLKSHSEIWSQYFVILSFLIQVW